LSFVANLVANVPAHLLNAIVGRMSVSLSDIKSDIKKPANVRAGCQDRR
jgi:hypothetical protein